MTRRRFLRATSLTLLILCLAAWGWSYLFREAISWHGHAIQLDRWGVLVGISYSNSTDDWEYTHEVADYDLTLMDVFVGRWLGFNFHHGRILGPIVTVIRIPMWFPTLLLAVLTWWTWRKTRATDGRGFAVEGAGETANDATVKASEP